MEIAEILAALDAVEAVEPLAAALPLAHVYQQEYFATALGDIGDPRAVPALIAALESHHGSYTFITDIIVGTLKDFGTPDALRAIESWEVEPIQQRPPPIAQALPRRRRSAAWAENHRISNAGRGLERPCETLVAWAREA